VKIVQRIVLLLLFLFALIWVVALGTWLDARDALWPAVGFGMWSLIGGGAVIKLLNGDTL
jgi:hypothetical protein